MIKLAIKIGLAVLVVFAVIFIFFPEYGEEKVVVDDELTEEEIEFNNMVAELEELEQLLEEINTDEIDNIRVE